MKTVEAPSRLKWIFIACVLAAAGIAAVVVYLGVDMVTIATQKESNPLFFGLTAGLLVAGLPLAWLWRTGELPQPAVCGILALATLSAFLAAVYLFRTASFAGVPADILIWSETGFVNNICKLRTGEVFYGSPQDSNTTLYTPGSEVLTYLIALTLGAAKSIPVYRWIQMGYVALSCVFATASCVGLAHVALPHRTRHIRLWVVAWFPNLFLVATNSTTNSFVHTLNPDALRLLVSSLAFWLMVRHAATGDNRWLVPMAVLPAVGFFVKQSLTVWVGIYVVYLILREPRAVRRIATFGAAAFLLIGVSVGACFLTWGEVFFYWTFELVSGLPVSPFRVLKHALDIWIFIAMGLVGGWILLRDDSFRRLFPLWVGWLLLMVVQLYTSGIAWMLHHMGPASLLGAVWFLVALAKVWPSSSEARSDGRNIGEAWVHVGLAVAVMCLLCGGMGLYRLPVDPVSADVSRYVEEIEGEFEGMNPERVLMDIGAWIHLRHDVVSKDRVAGVADQAVLGRGDFSAMLHRIESGYYRRILVRRLHDPDFLYEWKVPGTAWAKETGIKRALLQNYREVRRIREVDGTDWTWGYPFAEIHVLEPVAKRP